MSEPVFVFGSNLAGRHGKGAALAAKRRCTGNAYAIPTKDENIRTLPLERIARYVAEFVAHATTHPHVEFRVTALGTGLAAYAHEQIAPLFKDAPKNCELPSEWAPILNRSLCAFWTYDPKRD